MIGLTEAQQLAAHWVEIVTRGVGTVVPGATIKGPYGWIFFYDKKYVESRGRHVL